MSTTEPWHRRVPAPLVVAAGPLVLTLVVLIGLVPGHDREVAASAHRACDTAGPVPTDPIVAAALAADAGELQRLIDGGADLDASPPDNPFVTTYDAAVYAALVPYDTAALELLLAQGHELSPGVAERVLNRAVVARNPRGLELLVATGLDASEGEASIADLDTIVPHARMSGSAPNPTDPLGSGAAALLRGELGHQLASGNGTDSTGSDPGMDPGVDQARDAERCSDPTMSGAFPLIRAPGDDAAAVPPIAIAIVQRDLGDLTQLLFHGADANTLVFGRWTPLALAAADCDVDAVTMLLRVGPDVEVGPQGDRPIDLACPEVRPLIEAASSADATPPSP